MTAPRHFLTLMDLSADEIRLLIDRAIALKAQWRAGSPQRSMKGKREAMEDCLALIAQIEQQTVIVDTEE